MDEKKIKEQVSKGNPNEASEFIETKFGSRAVSKMNKSRIIALPKIALNNLCGSDDPTRLEVILVQKKDDKFIKLVPSCPKPKMMEND